MGRVQVSCHDDAGSGMTGKIFGSGSAEAAWSISKMVVSSEGREKSCMKSRLSNQEADPGDRLPSGDVAA